MGLLILVVAAGLGWYLYHARSHADTAPTCAIVGNNYQLCYPPAGSASTTPVSILNNKTGLYLPGIDWLPFDHSADEVFLHYFGGIHADETWPVDYKQYDQTMTTTPTQAIPRPCLSACLDAPFVSGSLGWFGVQPRRYYPTHSSGIGLHPEIASKTDLNGNPIPFQQRLEVDADNAHLVVPELTGSFTPTKAAYSPGETVTVSFTLSAPADLLGGSQTGVYIPIRVYISSANGADAKTMCSPGNMSRYGQCLDERSGRFFPQTVSSGQACANTSDAPFLFSNCDYSDSVVWTNSAGGIGQANEATPHTYTGSFPVHLPTTPGQTYKLQALISTGPNFAYGGTDWLPLYSNEFAIGLQPPQLSGKVQHNGTTTPLVVGQPQTLHGKDTAILQESFQNTYDQPIQVALRLAIPPSLTATLPVGATRDSDGTLVDPVTIASGATAQLVTTVGASCTTATTQCPASSTDLALKPDAVVTSDSTPEDYPGVALDVHYQGLSQPTVTVTVANPTGQIVQTIASGASDIAQIPIGNGAALKVLEPLATDELDQFLAAAAQSPPIAYQPSSSLIPKAEAQTVNYEGAVIAAATDPTKDLALAIRTWLNAIGSGSAPKTDIYRLDLYIYGGPNPTAAQRLAVQNYGRANYNAYELTAGPIRAALEQHPPVPGPAPACSVPGTVAPTLRYQGSLYRVKAGTNIAFQVLQGNSVVVNKTDKDLNTAPPGKTVPADLTVRLFGGYLFMLGPDAQSYQVRIIINGQATVITNPGLVRTFINNLIQNQTLQVGYLDDQSVAHWPVEEAGFARVALTAPIAAGETANFTIKLPSGVQICPVTDGGTTSDSQVTWDNVALSATIATTRFVTFAPGCQSVADLPWWSVARWFAHAQAAAADSCSQDATFPAFGIVGQLAAQDEGLLASAPITIETTGGVGSPPLASNLPVTPALTIDTNPDDYHAQLISQSTPQVTVTAGDNLTLTATLKNTGTATWYHDYLSLGTINPQDRCPGFDTVSGWYKCNRASFQEPSVAPGQTATFQMVWHVPANKVARTYHEAYQPVADEITWLTDASARPSWDITVQNNPHVVASGPTIDPNPNHYQAQFVGQSASTVTIRPGQTADITITLRNTGTATWYQDAFSLGTTSPSQDFVPGFDINLQDRSVDGWYKCNRVRFQEPSVAPGQTATFHFRMTAPANKLAGSYHYGFRPVVDEVTWLANPNLGLTIVVT